MTSDRVPPSGLPPDCSPLAREMRQALDGLANAVKESNEHVRVVENAYGLEYPAGQGEKPSDLERHRARQAMPGPLETLADVEKQLRHQLWRFSNARRELLGQPPLPPPKDEPERPKSFREVFSDPKLFKNKDL
jgi:hypothetical protein